MSSDYEKYPKLLEATNNTKTKFPERLLADFERILQHIEELWGSGEAVRYMDSLLLKDRPDRQGFPLEVLGEIAVITQLHNFLYPELVRNRFIAPVPTERSALFKEAFDLSFEKIGEQQPAALKTATSVPPQSAAKNVAWPEIRTQQELAEAAEVLRTRHRSNANQGKPVGEILHALGVIDASTLKSIGMEARPAKGGKHKLIGQLLLEKKIIDAEALTRALCIQAGVLMVDVLAIDIPSDTLNIISSDIARNKQVIPVGVYNKTLYLAVSDPFTFEEQPYFALLTGLTIVPVFATYNKIFSRLNLYSTPGARERSTLWGDQRRSDAST